MKALILAAGRGTRLASLTNGRPKILMPVCGVPMLERLLAGLERGGIIDVAINTHHLAEQVSAHVERIADRFPELNIRLFHEPELLGTGGAIVNLGDYRDQSPLLVWNGDVLADCSAHALFVLHFDTEALATLVVKEREDASQLLIDGEGTLCGIDSPARGGRRTVREPEGELRSVGFCGISILAPEICARFDKPGAFDLLDALLDVVADGGTIGTLDLRRGFWGTSGSPEELSQLEKELNGRPETLVRFTPER